MLTNSFPGRLILFAFMILVGFSIAKSLYVGSVLGAILAVTSLAAGVYFIYLLLNMRGQARQSGDEDLG